MSDWKAITMHADPLREGRFYIMEAMHSPGYPAPDFAVDDRINIVPNNDSEIPGSIVSVSGAKFAATFGDVTMMFEPSPPGLPSPSLRSAIPFEDYVGRKV